MLAGAAVGVVVAAVAWAYLFGGFIDLAPPRYPTFEAAKPVAIDAGGKYRWPGTAVRLHEIDAETIDVERRWLGLRESVVRVQQTAAGWDVGTPERGPARAVQELISCGLPAVGFGWLVATVARRRSGAGRSGFPSQRAGIRP